MNYTYKIISETDKHIEVLYLSAGYPNILIGLNCENDDKNKIIELNAPIARWGASAYIESPDEDKLFKVMDIYKGIDKYFDNVVEAQILYNQLKTEYDIKIKNELDIDLTLITDVDTLALYEAYKIKLQQTKNVFIKQKISINGNVLWVDLEGAK